MRSKLIVWCTNPECKTRFEVDYAATVVMCPRCGRDMRSASIQNTRGEGAPR